MSALNLSDPNKKKCVTESVRSLHVFEAIFSSVPTYNIIGAVRIQRGAQCVEFYQNPIGTQAYGAQTRKFVIEPGIFINDRFKQIQELAVVSKQQPEMSLINYSLCKNQTIRFMKTASRKEIWQASRLSYGLMGKTVILGKHERTTLYPPLNKTKILKEIGLFKVDDLQFCQEDEEYIKHVAAKMKGRK